MCAGKRLISDISHIRGVASNTPEDIPGHTDPLPNTPRNLDARKGRSLDRPFEVGAPGFEPGTSASRTQRSTGLSHAPTLSRRVDRKAIDPEHAPACELRLDCCRSSRQPDSNRRPQPWQGCALPAELCLRVHFNLPRWAREAALPSRSDLSSEARTTS